MKFTKVIKSGNNTQQKALECLQAYQLFKRALKNVDNSMVNIVSHPSMEKIYDKYDFDADTISYACQDIIDYIDEQELVKMLKVISRIK